MVNRMGSRPAAIETRSRSHGPLGTNSDPSLRPLPSPRLHVAGDVPPELSPLDAFAAQSRLLAKKLEEGTKGGKRMSRLPPLSIEGAFVGPRPGFIRSASAHDVGDTMTESHSSSLAMKMEVESASLRPISVHPQMSKISNRIARFNTSHTQDSDDETDRVGEPMESGNNFGIRTEMLPEPVGQLPISRVQNHSQSLLPGLPSADSIPQQRHDSLRYEVRTLAPPRSPFSRRTSSPRSTSISNSDEDLSASIAPSEKPNLRKFSSSSGLSTSPISPFMRRSPSVCSDLSASTNRLSRPAFNFSRPLSRASEPAAEIPARQASTDSDQYPSTDDAAGTPLGMLPDVSPTDVSGITAPSSIYSTFSLPRGKIPQCHSLISAKLEQSYVSSDRVESQNPEISFKPTLSPPLPSFTYPHEHQPLSEATASHSDHPIALTSTVTGHNPSNQSSQLGDSRHAHTSASETNTSPSLDLSLLPYANHASQEANVEDSAEWHVTKGIDCHERGSLSESTYHLRIAARLNHPTGMLLYALACRHGWGMRPNQQEGVQWLRKAADLAILEVTDDENSVRGGKTVDFIDKKTRKAQFALSIYELGVSHLNGWGIEQDKALALRCFEIAGAWGDGDALAEAGFCYAQGIGCKKDLKRSATFYHMAESKGISMVGNSWIYKSKYKDDNNNRDMTEPKKPRNKSQTRSIFTRKKSSA